MPSLPSLLKGHPKPRGWTLSNITKSAGGVEREKDDHYRERIHLAPEAFSCAGSEQAYIFHAKSARADIHDVAVESPTPGDVHLYVLLENGIVPAEDGPEIRAVVEKVSPKKVRPLNDRVKVFPGVRVPLAYRFRYFLYEKDAGYVEARKAAIKEATATFESWQTSMLGRDINPDELASLCRLVGAKRIEPEIVTLDDEGNVVDAAPLVFQKLEKKQVVTFIDHPQKVVLAGLEDE